MPTKPDRRGQHLKAKCADGKKPSPSDHTTLWAERAAQVEAVFTSRVGTPPWRRIDSDVTMGNAGRVLFMKILLHEKDKVVGIAFDKEKDSFLGITKIKILQPAAFDAVEGVYGEIHSNSWMRDHKSRTEQKTMKKHWDVAGFREICLSDGSVEYLFDAKVRDNQKNVAFRANIRRKGKFEKAVSAAPLAKNPMSVSELVHDDSLLHAAEMKAKVADMRTRAAEMEAAAAQLRADAKAMESRV